MHKIGYSRKSTGERTRNLQRDTLNATGCDRLFEDVTGGAKLYRPSHEQALRPSKEGWHSRFSMSGARLLNGYGVIDGAEYIEVRLVSDQ